MNKEQLISCAAAAAVAAIMAAAAFAAASYAGGKNAYISFTGSENTDGTAGSSSLTASDDAHKGDTATEPPYGDVTDGKTDVGNDTETEVTLAPSKQTDAWAENTRGELEIEPAPGNTDETEIVTEPPETEEIATDVPDTSETPESTPPETVPVETTAEETDAPATEPPTEETSETPQTGIEAPAETTDVAAEDAVDEGADAAE